MQKVSPLLGEAPNSHDPRSAFRRLIAEVERIADSVGLSDETAPTVTKLAALVTEALSEELGLSGGRLYIRQGDHFRLWSTFGAAQEVERGTRLPVDYRPVEICLAQGTLYMRAEDARVDRRLEDTLGAATFAAIEVGDGEYLLGFDLVPEHEADSVLFSLELLRYSINEKIRYERMGDVLRQARLIQQSILPRKMPDFGDYDLAVASQPVESVGGDFYDCIPMTDKILGLAIADVSGHGLAAALQVRDIYMGLRMGTSRDFKIVRTVERLNQIIHHSTLTSRFVSMFYGELEIDGTMIFVNAGHPPPIFLSADGQLRYLTEGGMILGPLPEATYTRGYLTMRPGDLIVACTDGLTEARCESGEEFGDERVLDIARRHQGSPAAEIVAEISAALESFRGSTALDDDVTVAAVSYRAS